MPPRDQNPHHPCCSPRCREVYLKKLEREQTDISQVKVVRPLKCPVCRKYMPPRDENPLFPFCSDRCRSVDLAKWIGEEYRLRDQQLGLTDESPRSEPREEEAAADDD